MLFSSRKMKKSNKIFTKYWKVYIIFCNVFSRNQSCIPNSKFLVVIVIVILIAINLF